MWSIIYMFSSVSWHQFTTALLILLGIYYFTVIIIYYRKDLALFAKKQDPVPAPQPGLTKGTDDNNLLFSAVHDLMEELKGIFHKASRQDYPKEELMMALQLKLRDYPKLKDTPFRVSINNHIEQESKEKCQTVLTETDIRNLW